jgi:hypothetical protein
VCAGPACPSTVRNDCVQRLDELERAQPTMVFDARDVYGVDIVDVHVLVDGQELAERLTGLALAVDPGEHTFEFVTPGWLPVSRRFVVREGEKSRAERVVFKDLAATPARLPTLSDDLTLHPRIAAVSIVTSTGRAEARPLEKPWATEQGRWGIVVGGAGVAGLVAGGLFGLSAASDWNRSTADCPPTTCTWSGYARAVVDSDLAKSRATLSTIGFATGIALLIGGVVLLATAHPRSATERLSRGGLVRWAEPGPQAYALEGAF